MTYRLGIDPHSREWSELAVALRERIETLRTDCAALGSTDRQRLEAAVRIDELVLLLGAPGATERRARGVEELTRKVY